MPSRRILVVGRPKCGKLAFVKGLTGSIPQLNSDESEAGLSHTLNLKTQYYTADVPLWIDEFDDSDEWSAAFRTKEAKEVLAVLGAFVFVFERPNHEEHLELIKSDLKAVASVVKACGFHWDGVCLAVAMPNAMQPQLEKTHEEWEDVCQDLQFEFVDFEATGRNDYGEPVGMERLREALEANDWEGMDNDDDGLDEAELSGDESEGNEGDEGIKGKSGSSNGRKNGKDGLSKVADELEDEISELHASIYADQAAEGNGNGDMNNEINVEKLENAMLRLQAVRDMAADLPEAERKKLAARTVAEIMKTI